MLQLGALYLYNRTRRVAFSVMTHSVVGGFLIVFLFTSEGVPLKQLNMGHALIFKFFIQISQTQQTGIVL